MLLSWEVLRRDLVASGTAFDAAGAYERLILRAHGQVDPIVASNRGIALIGQAPRNAQGCVEYRMDVHLMRPVDAARGNGRLLLEVNNRGRKLLFGYLCDGPMGVNDPLERDELGNAFVLRQGYTVVWNGWDVQVPRGRGWLALDAPIASRDGEPIVQRVRDEFVSGTRLGVLQTLRLSATPASLDPARARLTRRCRQSDSAQEVPADQWSFVDHRAIRLLDPAQPFPGWLYEFHYDAIDPPVQGLGFAATRDLVSALRHDPAALELTGAPMSHALAIGISQAGRYLRDHLALGFNRDEAGRRVFDGMLVHIAGAGRVGLNQPFAQPARTRTRHEDHQQAENRFPFSAARQTDPATGRSACLLRGDDSDPLLIETNTSTEYWQKAASLLHTDPQGQRDAALPEGVRVYLIAGTQHGGRAGAPADEGPNVHPRNPHSPMPVLRALLMALDRWVRGGEPPAPSRVPRVDDGSLVDAALTGFPDLPGVRVPREANPVGSTGEGAGGPHRAADGPVAKVCRVDADGNEVAGIRLPDVAVPLATWTGWNWYRAPYPSDALADRDGSRLPFARRRAERLAQGDPRLAVSERYASRADYGDRVQAVVDALVRDGLLLPQDAQDAVERALAQPGWSD